MKLPTLTVVVDRCIRCLGTGKVGEPGREVRCPRCFGSGKYAETPAER